MYIITLWRHYGCVVAMYLVFFYQIAMHAGKMGVTEFILRTKEFQL